MHACKLEGPHVVRRSKNVNASVFKIKQWWLSMLVYGSLTECGNKSKLCYYKIMQFPFDALQLIKQQNVLTINASNCYILYILFGTCACWAAPYSGTFCVLQISFLACVYYVPTIKTHVHAQFPFLPYVCVNIQICSCIMVCA